MKILHVIETLGVGGAEQHLVTLLPELCAIGDEVFLAVLREPLDLRMQLERAGVPVIVLGNQKRWKLISGARQIAQIVRELDIDVVHAHLFFPSVYTSIFHILWRDNVSTCVTFHNLAYVPGVNSGGPKLWFRRQLAKFLYKRGFDKKIGVSDAVAEHYKEALALDSVSVLRNPIDLQEIERVSHKAAPRNFPFHGSPRVVVPGRLVHEKGHIDFLDALALLVENGFDVFATLAGGGPLREKIEKRILSLGLGERVAISGVLPHFELLKAMVDADIVVVPSRFEGFGLTALEAMALGRPLVATSVGGLKEVVSSEETGILVPPADPEALATAIARLATDSHLRCRLSEAAKKDAKTRYAAPEVAAKLRGIYSQMMLGRYSSVRT